METSVGRASINRENGRRFIGIRMNVRGRDMGGFVNEARDRVEQDASLGKGMTIDWGGEVENKERAMARLAMVVTVALLITLVLLFKAFDSLSLETLLNVPFALLGGVFGLWAFGFSLSVSAAWGSSPSSVRPRSTACWCSRPSPIGADVASRSTRPSSLVPASD